MLAEILASNKSVLSRIASFAFSFVFVYDHLQNAENGTVALGPIKCSQSLRMGKVIVKP